MRADPASPALHAPPCPVYLLPLENTYGATAFRAAWHLRRFLRQNEVRVVQTFFESSDIWGGLATKLLSPAKLIWSRRDMGILRTAKHRAAYRMLASLPDAVFAVAEGVRRYTIETDKVAPSHVYTIYNGLELAGWAPPCADVRAEALLQPATVLTVGNIRHVKGHDVLLKAAALVVRQLPNTLFAIAGAVLDPAYREELDTLISTLGLEKNIRFLGGVSNPRACLAAADIFVLPSRSEGFSNAIVEAMAASLPVVATDVGGNAEAVQHGITGLIVPPEEPSALAEALLRLLKDPALAHRMGEEGRRAAAERFTTEAMMRSTTAVYNSLLARPST